MRIGTLTILLALGLWPWQAMAQDGRELSRGKGALREDVGDFSVSTAASYTTTLGTTSGAWALRTDRPV